MDFQFSEDQRLFRATLHRFLADHPRVLSPRPDDPAAWELPQRAALAGLGVNALLLPELAGGLDLGAVEAIIVGDELGRAVLATSFVDTVVIAGGVVAALGSDAQRSGVLPRIAAGDALVALAGHVRSERGPALTCRRDGDSVEISGAVDFVTFAPVASYVMLVAEDDAGGRSALLVDTADLAPFTRSFWSVDDLPVASLAIDKHRVRADQMLGSSGEAGEILDRQLELGVAVQGAELVGVMATLLNATLEQLRTRKQFGSVLAGFQALQHRLTEMAVLYEQALSLVLKAAATLSSPDATARERAVCALKVQVSRSARLIGHEAVQMHGAMGMTEELIVGPALRRIRALEPRLGTPSHYLDRYRELRLRA